MNADEMNLPHSYFDAIRRVVAFAAINTQSLQLRQFINAICCHFEPYVTAILVFNTILLPAYTPCLAFSSYLHFVSAQFNVTHLCSFLFLFTTQVFKNKPFFSCSNFISTINQLHSILLFIVTSSHTISLFKFIHLIFIYIYLE